MNDADAKTQLFDVLGTPVAVVVCDDTAQARNALHDFNACLDPVFCVKADDEASLVELSEGSDVKEHLHRYR